MYGLVQAPGRATYVPCIGHIGPQTVLLESGAVIAMAHIDGFPFELVDHSARMTRLWRLNTLYRNLADDNVTIYTHLVRHSDLSTNPLRQNACLF